MASPTEVLDRLLLIALLFQQDMARAFEGTALTTARVHLLWEVHRSGPATQAALATALEVTPRNITGLVDALEWAGYAERRAHPTDRRAVLVALTQQGEAAMAAMAREHDALAVDLVSGIDPERLSRLDGELELIADRLQQLVTAAGRGQS